MVDELLKEISDKIAGLDKNIVEWSANPDGDYCYPINYCEKEKAAWLKVLEWINRGKTPKWMINKISPLIPKYKKLERMYYKQSDPENDKPMADEHDAACNASSWETILKWVKNIDHA